MAMLRKRAAVSAMIVAASAASMGSASSGALVFSLLAAGGEGQSAALGAAAPPASLLASRDRSATEPLRRRPKSCWWEETMDPEHTDDAEFKQQVRVPRCVFFKVLRTLSTTRCFASPSTWESAGWAWTSS